MISQNFRKAIQIFFRNFKSEYFEQMMNQVTELIAPYVEKDPTAFCTYEEYEKGVETLRVFCLLR